MTLLFISDLHLHEQRPHITEAFFAFLQDEAKQADSLYILGDLFDAWIGDDDDSPLTKAVATQLNTFTKTGSKIFFQHGNRDFLLGSEYAKKCNMNLLPQLHIITHNNERWLLAHGDQFCTADTEYQDFRKRVRDPAWQNELMKKSLDERRLIAQQLREKSKDANSLKAEDIMDVTPAAFISTLKDNNCQKLIHGHTHRPERHPISIKNNLHERIVLGDWDQSMWYLLADEENTDLIKADI